MTLLLLLLPSFASAYTYTVEVRGAEAFLSGPGSSHQAPLRTGMQAQDGDTVQTGERTVVMLVSSNGHKLSLGPRTSLLLETGRDKDGQFNRVELVKGSVRSLIRSSGGENKKFELRSNSVSVGVRGTDFFSVTQGPQGLKVYLQEGALVLQDKEVLHAGNKALITPDGRVISSPLGPNEFQDAMDREGFREVAALLEAPPVNRGNEKTLAVLVQSGDLAALEARNLSPADLDDFGAGEGAFHVALRAGRTEFVPWLLQRKANVNAPDKDGKTALMIAIERKEIEAVKALLNAGANTRLTDSKGQNSFDYARKSEIKQIQDLVSR